MKGFMIRPDQDRPGAFELFIGATAQSWVDLNDPTNLAYEYQQRIAEALETTVLDTEETQRIRVIHLGGGAMSIPRYVAYRRPCTAQIVCEPNAELTEAVRRNVPLPRQSGIKVREKDGRTGLAEMPDDYADCLVVDAFDGDQIPADLATDEFFADTARVLRPGGVLTMNLTGKAPFDWAKRVLAAITNHYRHLAVSTDPATWKGRRFGNLVAVAAHSPLPVEGLSTLSARAPLPSKLISGEDLSNWIGQVEPFTDRDQCPSPSSKGWL